MCVYTSTSVLCGEQLPFMLVSIQIRGVKVTCRSTVMSLIIRTNLNNFIFGIRILWNTLINDFSRKGRDVRIISGIVQHLDQ